MKITELQERLEREMKDGWKLSFLNYCPLEGGIVELELKGKLVLSENFETVIQGYETALKFIENVASGVIVPVTIKRITPEGFLEAFCEGMLITRDDLTAKTRKREVVKARQVLASLIYLNFKGKASLASVGALLGGLDHATIMHCNRTVKNLLETDKFYRSYYTYVVERINSLLGVAIESLKIIQNDRLRYSAKMVAEL